MNDMFFACCITFNIFFIYFPGQENMYKCTYYLFSIRIQKVENLSAWIPFCLHSNRQEKISVCLPSIHFQKEENESEYHTNLIVFQEENLSVSYNHPFLYILIAKITCICESLLYIFREKGTSVCIALIFHRIQEEENVND